jgi:hypothetical protein
MSIFDNRKLINRQKIVVFDLVVVDKSYMLADGSTIFEIFDVHAVGDI